MLNAGIVMFERVTLCMAIVAAGLILGMSCWITYDVLTRYFLDWASPWAFDLSEYALIWITFLGAPWVLLQDRHVRIELLVDVLPKSIQRALGIAVCLIAFAACVVLAWKTSVAALQYYDRGIMMPRIWRIPRIYPYSIIPIGSMFLGTVFLVRLRLYISETDPESALHKRASAGQETGFSDESAGIE